MYSFATLLTIAFLPTPLISIYTRPMFFAVPVIIEVDCAASAPYLCPTTASNRCPPTFKIRFIESSRVERIKSTDKINRVFVFELRGGKGGGCGDGALELLLGGNWGFSVYGGGTSPGLLLRGAAPLTDKVDAIMGGAISLLLPFAVLPTYNFPDNSIQHPNRLCAHLYGLTAHGVYCLQAFTSTWRSE